MNKLYDRSSRVDDQNRSNYFNNAKFILIMLVVIGHIMSCIKDINHTAFQIDFFVYSFHMPAFILLSGYLSKSCAGSWKKSLKHAGAYFSVYIVAQIVFDGIQRYWLHSVTEPFSLFSPRIGLWYLMVLIVWTLLLKPVSKIPPRILFPGLILAGLAIGLWSGAGKEYALSRMIVFYPFFMAGYYLKPSMIEQLHEIWFRMGSAMVISISALVCSSIVSMKYLDIFMGNQAYSQIGISNTTGLVYRSIWYILSSFTVVAFLSLVPRGRIFFTHLGNRTLQVFILHSIICRILFVKETLDGVLRSTNIFVIFAISIVLVFVLSNRRLTKLVAWPQDLLYNMSDKILAR